MSNNSLLDELITLAHLNGCEVESCYKGTAYLISYSIGEKYEDILVCKHTYKILSYKKLNDSVTLWVADYTSVYKDDFYKLQFVFDYVNNF